MRRECQKTFTCLLSALVLSLYSGTAVAEDEKKPDGPPKITAVAPLEIVAGATTSLRVRGLLLGDATELRVADAPTIAVEMKEKKKADVPNGLEAKKVGDTQVEAAMKVPADFPAEKLRFCVVTPKGTTEWKEIRVVQAAALVEEKEPDNGFREAQCIEPGSTVRGVIKEDKDVDVFRVEGHRGKRLQIEIFASRGGSLLDPTLMLFDAQGHLIASGDDESTDDRDARLNILLPANGVYFVSITDANDRGGEWHSYTLAVTEVQP
ncbi:PPC domain-containing protein [Verrucomicrobiota bacterium sgz303538]